MIKRHCFVADVGIAIEALADALDPERNKPFGGDILDLLEWATKDVKELRADIDQLCQQLAVVQAENLRLTAMPFASEAVRAVVYGRKIDELNQQLATANTAFDVVQKDCWNLTEKVIPNLRQQFAERDKQVMLLREKFQELADNFVWNGDDHSYQHWVIEVSQAALTTTEPKQ